MIWPNGFERNSFEGPVRFTSGKRKHSFAALVDRRGDTLGGQKPGSDNPCDEDSEATQQRAQNGFSGFLIHHLVVRKKLLLMQVRESSDIFGQPHDLCVGISEQI